MNCSVPLLILMWSILALSLSADDPIQLPLKPAPLFPELSPHYPLRFTPSNEQLISNKELRLTEWNQHSINKPSWLAMLALLSSLSLFFLPEAKQEKRHRNFPVTKINGKNPSEAYIQVINSSRKYLEFAYNLSASKFTLEENLHAIENAFHLSQKQKNFLKQAYTKSEAIKFNQITSTESEFQELIQKFHVEFPHFYSNLFFLNR